MQTYPVCCSCSCGGCRKPQNGVENSIEVNFTSENLLLKTQADLLKKTTCVGCIKLFFFFSVIRKHVFTLFCLIMPTQAVDHELLLQLEV